MVSATKGAPKTAEDHLTQGVRVSAIHVRGMCEAIQCAGHSLDPFLARAKLDISQLADRGGWIGLAEFARLLREAVRYTRDPAFGLHWGDRSPMLQYDVGPTLVANAANLRGAIDALLELQLIFVDRTQCWFVQSGRRSELRLDPFAVNELHRRAVSELTFAAVGPHTNASHDEGTGFPISPSEHAAAWFAPPVLLVQLPHPRDDRCCRSSP